MKAILEFDLGEDREDFAYAIMGSRSHLCLWEMWDELHRAINDWEPEATTNTDEAEYWISRLIDIMETNGVPLETHDQKVFD